MNYTILKQWKTVDGQYYSATVNNSNYDLAFGGIHSMVKPMQNDVNVAYFRLELFDEYGGRPMRDPIVWTRHVEEPTVEE